MTINKNVTDLFPYFNMIQHELLLGVVQRTVRTFEDRHFLTGYVLVKVRVEQCLLGKNCVTHGTLVDQPAKQHILVKRVFSKMLCCFTCLCRCSFLLLIARFNSTG